MDSSARIFLDYSARKIRQLTERIEDCLGRLTDEQIWARGAEAENAIGNLVLHLTGNVRQWIISGVGGQPGVRHRDEEFAARGGPSAAELATRLRRTVDNAAAVLDALPPDGLAERIRVQNYDVTALEAIYSCVEHFSGHTGQIIFATKLFTGKDLGYYRYLNTPAPHSGHTP
jgi:uncharacterized damage-inducible protein DinB